MQNNSGCASCENYYRLRYLRYAQQNPERYKFVGQTAAIAKIVLLDGLIEGACEEVVDQGMPSRMPRSKIFGFVTKMSSPTS